MKNMAYIFASEKLFLDYALIFNIFDTFFTHEYKDAKKFKWLTIRK